ncbi:hypothetical protein K1X84_10490 [bacterium]|nr:hypothetical protein [bacterium]
MLIKSIIIKCSLVFFCYITTSCLKPSTSHGDLKRNSIVVDSVSVKEFGEKVSQRFADYQASSKGKTFKAMVSGKIRGLVFKHSIPKDVTLVLYTYDEQDSCVLYSGQLPSGESFLNALNLPIPVGDYYVFDGGHKIPFMRIKDQ